MDHRYLARNDGSEQAAGRGSGADSQEKRRPPAMTPYMQMTYYPTERRLDTAIFRALFASSARQARQFCVHGLVKVNGKKMLYPGYMLNPGDLFQVEPSSVMFATGAPKTRSSAARKAVKAEAAERAEAREKDPKNTTSDSPSEPLTTREEPTPTELKKHMQTLMQDVEDVLNEDVGAKDKQKFRALRTHIRKSIGLWKTASPETVSTLDQQFDFLKDAVASKNAERSSASSAAAAADPGADSLMSSEDQLKLKKAFEKLKLETEHTSVWNGRQRAAPYATPWRPRDYMSAFAFIPRYLEVNQNICAAVYLRHPVARPGLAEVPTPFHLETGQLAFNWYLRRR
jgi:ribosomal protein S4